MKFLFLDTETTGLEADKCGVIQIAGIVDIDGTVQETFNFKCRPFITDQVSDDAMRLLKLTREEIKLWPDPHETYLKLLGVLDRYVDRFVKLDKFYMVGQNTRFDYGMMDAWFKRNGNQYFYAYVFYHLVDLVSCSALFKLAGRIDIPNMKLETMAKAFSVPLIAHDALGDVTATREIFYKCVDALKI